MFFQKITIQRHETILLQLKNRETQLIELYFSIFINHKVTLLFLCSITVPVDLTDIIMYHGGGEGLQVLLVLLCTLRVPASHTSFECTTISFFYCPVQGERSCADHTSIFMNHEITLLFLCTIEVPVDHTTRVPTGHSVIIMYHEGACRSYWYFMYYQSACKSYWYYYVPRGCL